MRGCLPRHAVRRLVVARHRQSDAVMSARRSAKLHIVSERCEATGESAADMACSNNADLHIRSHRGIAEAEFTRAQVDCFPRTLLRHGARS
jgi:hypothetical protein